MLTSWSKTLSTFLIPTYGSSKNNKWNSLRLCFKVLNCLKINFSWEESQFKRE